MKSQVTLLVLAFLAAMQSVAAFSITVPAQERRCFFETVEKDDYLHVSYQVDEGGHHDIDFTLEDSNGYLVEDAKRAPSGNINHDAKSSGKYQFCFINTFSTMTEKVVGFNSMVIKPYRADAAHKADPLEKEIRELASGIMEVRNEQEYTLARERTHRNTAESTNTRVVWWSLFQAGLLFVVCAFQITYLKRFFEVKRVV
ncbi:p24 complex component [Lunasporangiospora selenospora]|uniref:P24 complex component n=1 Tax=Lunasporangiospora selenospora TaxID=979761 RepID=A0A9P6KCV6_9FUNG|nr:p24 complex component [Lunasporangiospora selenospora]